MTFETLKLTRDGAVLFAEISAPPMNLWNPELVRDLVTLIQYAEADDSLRVLVFNSADPDYFIAHVDVTHTGQHRDAAVKLTGEASLGMLFRHLSASRLIDGAGARRDRGGWRSPAPHTSNGPWPGARGPSERRGLRR
jgi:enoyl-CoA hydratase/carnithine racemase